ncbi:Vps33a [Symbiodinium sp. CCMP2456]|nr:Vps33a [Symbiodinium sp. CCMP2456]
MDSAVTELVEAVRADVRARLLDLLDEVTGRKVLLLDSTIVGPLDLIVSPSDLKDHGVQQWHKLSDQTVAADCSQMIFLVRCARIELVDMMAKQILADEKEQKERLYVAVFVPNKTEECVQRLAASNVKANVRITECAIHHFPSDKDVLSMETPRLYHDFHVLGDPSGPFYAAQALMSLQQKFGTIPSVHAIGGAGRVVVEVMQRLRKEDQAGQAKLSTVGKVEIQPGVPPVAAHPKGAAAIRRREEASLTSPALASASPEVQEAKTTRINELVVIDRRVDLFSVLCSQFTYQALIDSAYGIQNNLIDISNASWAKDRGNANSTVRLSPDDPFYQEIRDLHIDKLGPLLEEKARAVQQTYSEKDNVKHKSASDMAEYIKKFKTAQSAHPLLEMHINLAHDLKDKIQSEDYRQMLKLEDEITAQSTSSQSCLDTVEDIMDDQKPFHEALRLLCLLSLVNNGIKAKQLDQLKRTFLQSYGFEHMLTLANMERAGLLRYQHGKSGWSTIKRQFNLFVEDGAADQDISYAYSGYAPLSVRLVQMTRSQPKGWMSLRDALSLLHGPAQELQQPESNSAKEQDGNKSSIVLVCFLGGVTSGEIAALRRLAELEDGRRRFLIMTTEFINSKKLFDSMRNEEVFKQAPVEGKARPQERSLRGFGFWPTSR